MALVNQSFQVLPIGSEDFDRTIDFLSRFFYVDSPINAHLRTPFTDMARCHREYLSHGCSFQAVDDASGRIIGVFVNHPLNARDEGVSVHQRYTDEKYALIVRFLEFLEAQSPLFATGFPDCDRALDASILSVDTECRGMGVGRALIERTIQFARESGYPLVTCMCSSVFSARLCEQVGFEERFRYEMGRYVDVDGTRPLQLEAPHTEAILFAMRL